MRTHICICTCNLVASAQKWSQRFWHLFRHLTRSSGEPAGANQNSACTQVASELLSPSGHSHPMCPHAKARRTVYVSSANEQKILIKVFSEFHFVQISSETFPVCRNIFDLSLDNQMSIISFFSFVISFLNFVYCFIIFYHFIFVKNVTIYCCCYCYSLI